MYGGSTTSVLVNVPGEPASVVTTLDGYQMAKKGRAGAALAIAAIGSFAAGTVSVIALQFFAPLLARTALAFGPAEYFVLTALGVILLSNLTGKSRVRSLIMMIVGLILSTVGMDPIGGLARFSFGIETAQGGISFIAITTVFSGSPSLRRDGGQRKAAGDPPGPVSGALSHPAGTEAFRGPHRPRLRVGVSDRPPAGTRRHHGLLRVLRPGTVRLQTS
jgi:putative tricarboxylic transport membrane protein